ncbi:MAG: Sua5/YciO/YrdC/YwlC family protein [Marine Group I thaumarchaeote]|nr:MAG: Sua5/YciO/YrdC/YwlC family protein [Marine Group I thaumarchaeote]
MRVNCDSNGINTTVKSIKEGKIVVFPTDTVYGIGCDPYNKEAVEKVYRIKNRKQGKLFPVLGFSKNELEKIANFNEKANKIAEKFWPGRLTLILPLKDEKLKTSMNLENKVAVRVPNNSCALAILEQCNLIIGTSANVSGMESFVDPDECEKNISDYDVFVDSGKISSKGESTVIEISEDEVVVHRKGSISKEEILNLF